MCIRDRCGPIVQSTKHLCGGLREQIDQADRERRPHGEGKDDVFGEEHVDWALKTHFEQLQNARAVELLVRVCFASRGRAYALGARAEDGRVSTFLDREIGHRKPSRVPNELYVQYPGMRLDTIQADQKM